MGRFNRRHVNAAADIIPHERRGYQGHVAKGARRLVWYRDGGTCHYCGVAVEYAEMTADHVIPASQGGSNGVENLVCACQPCNVAKGARDYRDFKH